MQAQTKEYPRPGQRIPQTAPHSKDCLWYSDTAPWMQFVTGDASSIHNPLASQGSGKGFTILCHLHTRKQRFRQPTCSRSHRYGVAFLLGSQASICV